MTDAARNNSGEDAFTQTGTQVGPLPYRFCRDNQVIIEGTFLLIAPSAPISAIGEALRVGGEQVTALQSVSQDTFDLALNSVFNQDAFLSPEMEAQSLEFDLEEDPRSGQQSDLLETTTDAPIIQLVNSVMRKAVASRASDVHIEPTETSLLVRFRVDGILAPVIERQDIPVRQVVARLKVMANLDTSETRLPQDGRISMRYGDRSIDVRLSSLPGVHGERLVMRLLDRKVGLRDLKELGLTAVQDEALRRIAARPDGVVLTTGPTGSGKTTTLYSLLRTIDTSSRNVVTVEDPVEYKPTGISQIQVAPDIGLTFSVGLRAALRQDPDVIMIGEIRDNETAKIASQAALTGHLVLSSLHTNSCIGAITRLRDLGLEDFLISATLRAVLAQRTLRKLCGECAGAGCKTCDMSGYFGRIGVFEVAEITNESARAIADGASEHEIDDLLVRHGGQISEVARSAVDLKLTDASELYRVLGVAL